MQKITAWVLAISVIACLMVSNLNYASADENEWVSKADMPTARACVHTATVNDKIYVIGGGGPTGTNEEYDPQNDTWTTKASMPFPEQNFAIAVYQNKIYCIGGQDQNQVYDTATDTWEIKADLPTPRAGATAQVVDGKIYVIGGVQSGYNQGVEAQNVTEVYDPQTDTWTTKTAIPYAVPSVSAVINNKIYLIGSEITQIYDPQTDTWITATNPPETINLDTYGISAAVTATTGEMAPKRIYVYDGTNLYVYNPYDDSWTYATPPPTSRQFAAMAVVDDKLYVIGGESWPIEGMSYYFILHKTNEQYTPVGYGATPTPSPFTIPSATPKPFTASAQVIVAVSVAIMAVAAISVGVIIYWKKRRH